jgi:hypothetical protein
MAPKKSMKNLSKKGINLKQAAKVKGGRMKLDPLSKEKLAANHNQTDL